MPTFLLIQLAGCGLTAPETEATFTRVRGQVSLDGLPLAGARIAFLPMPALGNDGRLLPISYGEADGEGNFQLRRGSEGQGAQVGRHRIVISARTERGGAGAENAKLQSAADALIQQLNLGRDLSPTTEFGDAPRVAAGERVPAIYNVDSMLMCVVPADSNDLRIVIRLTSVDPVLAGTEDEIIQWEPVTAKTPGGVR